MGFSAILAQKQMFLGGENLVFLSELILGKREKVDQLDSGFYLKIHIFYEK